MIGLTGLALKSLLTFNCVNFYMKWNFDFNTVGIYLYLANSGKFLGMLDRGFVSVW